MTLLSTSLYQEKQYLFLTFSDFCLRGDKIKNRKTKIILNMSHGRDHEYFNIKFSQRAILKFYAIHSTGVSDCCLTPTQQFFSYIMERTS
jgi:hypothetical protein